MTGAGTGRRGGERTLPGLFCIVSVFTAIILMILLTGCRDPRRETVIIDQAFPGGVQTAESAAGGDSGTESFPADGEDAVKRKTDRICIFVCGAVQQPGVYELPKGARAQDALVAAGGFTEEADTEYVNLAQPVSDGQQLRFPTEEEVQELRRQESAPETGNTSGVQPQAQVNINTAGVPELMTLPGIGQVRAEEIIRYRSQMGPFAAPEEIMNVSGIGEASYARIRDRITVN